MDFQTNYRVSTFIRQGSYGDFYRCISTQDETVCAVKISQVNRTPEQSITNSPKDKQDVNGFSKRDRADLEVAIWRRLEHSNLPNFK